MITPSDKLPDLGDLEGVNRGSMSTSGESLASESVVAVLEAIAGVPSRVTYLQVLMHTGH